MVTVVFVVVVSFPLEEDANVAILAWTTTPWTLPSNVALCVHPDSDYVKVKGAYNQSVTAACRMYVLQRRNIQTFRVG